MYLEQNQITELANTIATAIIKSLEDKNIIGGSFGKSDEKTAYQKTEQLLYNYKGFKRIIREKEQEIVDLQTYGVPQSCAVREFVQKGNVVSGIVLEEESVEQAVQNVQKSVQGTVQIVSLIDKCMAALESDPYYKILEMRYFEGRTQEDIAVQLNITQKTVSINKSRLVKELAMRLFPDQVANEMMR
jgi:RNA polymerase sigma factor (sigma-70 family)